MQATGCLDRGGESLLFWSPGILANLDLYEHGPPPDAGYQVAGAGRAEPDQPPMLVLQGACLVFEDETAYAADGKADAVAGIAVIHAISPLIFADSLAATLCTPHSSHAARNSRRLGRTSPAAASHRLPPCLPRWVHW